MCVRTNDGRVNSIPPFHSVFLYIFQRFERNSIEESRTVRAFPRFQGTRNKRNKRRFDSLRVRVYAFRMRPLLAFRFAFVPSLKGNVVSRSTSPESETRYRYRSFRCYVIKQPCTRRDAYKETSITLDEQSTMIFPVYFNRVIHFPRGFEREKNISVSLSIYLSREREREKEKNTRCIFRYCCRLAKIVMRILKRNCHLFKGKRMRYRFK